ncbi:hypothetical protein LPJ56_000603 [Coemansia sp. RSA 2599]|nr:hypothetical protein LPJ56_000603 [Coemansia sp. RSA 2599]
MSSSNQRKAPWDRNTKYWCQYCQIFVHDNKSSRRMHETGAKHKENVQKYLRQIDKGVKEKQETEAKLRSELDRIERAAAASYSRDIGAAEAHAIAEPEPAKDTGAAKATTNDAENDKQQQDNRKKCSKPDNIGVIGAWEIVEEPEPEPEPEPGSETEAVSKNNGGLDRSKTEPGKSDFLDTGRSGEDRGDGGFDIEEKTVESVQAHFKRRLGSDEAPSRADAAAAETAVGSLFKKRRTTSNRNNARRQIDKTKK